MNARALVGQHAGALVVQRNSTRTGIVLAVYDDDPTPLLYVYWDDDSTGYVNAAEVASLS